MREYSMDLASALLQRLKERGQTFRWEEAAGMAICNMTLRSPIRNAECRILTGSTTLTSRLICPVSADYRNPEEMRAVSEYLTRINSGLIYGNFEFDFDDGTIRIRCTAVCGNALPTAEMLDDFLDAPVDLMERYLDSLLQVIFGVSTPKEAIERCESVMPEDTG